MSVGNAVSELEVACAHRGAEAVLCVVGEAHPLVDGVRAEGAEDGSEDLLLGNGRVQIGRIENCGLDVVAGTIPDIEAAAEAAAALVDPGALTRWRQRVSEERSKRSWC